MKTGSLINNYIVLLGISLLAQGIWGLFSETIFAVMTTNLTHAIIHIVLGIAGIVLASRHNAYVYSIFTGALLLAVGGLYMIPSTSWIVVKLFNVNSFVAVFNVIAGGFSLLVAYAGGRYRYINN